MQDTETACEGENSLICDSHFTVEAKSTAVSDCVCSDKSSETAMTRVGCSVRF